MIGHGKSWNFGFAASLVSNHTKSWPGMLMYQFKYKCNNTWKNLMSLIHRHFLLLHELNSSDWWSRSLLPVSSYDCGVQLSYGPVHRLLIDHVYENCRAWSESPFVCWTNRLKHVCGSLKVKSCWQLMAKHTSKPSGWRLIVCRLAEKEKGADPCILCSWKRALSRQWQNRVKK